MVYHGFNIQFYVFLLLSRVVDLATPSKLAKWGLLLVESDSYLTIG